MPWTLPEAAGLAFTRGGTSSQGAEHNPLAPRPKVPPSYRRTVPLPRLRRAACPSQAAAVARKLAPSRLQVGQRSGAVELGWRRGVKRVGKGVMPPTVCCNDQTELSAGGETQAMTGSGLAYGVVTPAGA